MLDGGGGSGGEVAGTTLLAGIHLTGTHNNWGQAFQNAFNSLMDNWNFQQRSREGYDRMAGVRNDHGVMWMSGDLFGFSDLIGIGLARLAPDSGEAFWALSAIAIIATKGRAADDVVKAEAAIAKAEVTAAKANVKVANYKVYQGVENGVVKYVGITKRNPLVRFAEHQATGGPKSLLDFELVNGATGLTRTQARVMEQNLINQHGLVNLYNKINSISPQKWSMYGVTP